MGDIIKDNHVFASIENTNQTCGCLEWLIQKVLAPLGGIAGLYWGHCLYCKEAVKGTWVYHFNYPEHPFWSFFTQLAGCYLLVPALCFLGVSVLFYMFYFWIADSGMNDIGNKLSGKN